MVTSPNFRHPIPLAKDLLSIDDISEGRLIVGVGSGGLGPDSTVLGGAEWSLRERSERFVEFVGLLDELLRNSDTTSEGTFYSAHEARMLPGTVQQPRPPILIAGNGPRGMLLAAQFGDGWITLGRSVGESQSCLEIVTGQVVKLNETLEAMDRTPKRFEKVLLSGLSDERPLDSLDAFVDWAGKYQDAGMSELVIHWPESDSMFEADMSVFEQIATEGISQI
jgi:hypothetical protein